MVPLTNMVPLSMCRWHPYPPLGEGGNCDTVCSYFHAGYDAGYTPDIREWLIRCQHRVTVAWVTSVDVYRGDKNTCKKFCAVIMSLFLCVLAPLQADAEEKIVRFCHSGLSSPTVYPENGKPPAAAIDIVDSKAFCVTGLGKITGRASALEPRPKQRQKGKFDGVVMIFKNAERETCFLYSARESASEVVAFFKHARILPVTAGGSF